MPPLAAVLQADAFALPFRDGAFEIVVADPDVLHRMEMGKSIPSEKGIGYAKVGYVPFRSREWWTEAWHVLLLEWEYGDGKIGRQEVHVRVVNLEKVPPEAARPRPAGRHRRDCEGDSRRGEAPGDPSGRSRRSALGKGEADGD